MWEDIQQVRAHSRRAHNFREHHHRPSSAEADEREFFLQGLAIEDHCPDSESAWYVRAPETVLRAVLAAVRFDVGVGEEVVEEVSEELADDAADDGGEVEERGLGVVQEVWGWADELRYGGYDADGPGEEHEDEEAWGYVRQS